MSYTPCIERPANSRFIILREEYIRFTDNNRCAALLLAYFEYQHNYRLANVFHQQELADEGKIDYTYKEADLYQQQSLRIIETGIMNEYRRETISQAIDLLVDKNAIKIIKESSYKNNEARRYLFLPDTINHFMKYEYTRDRKIDYDRDRKIDSYNKERQKESCEGKDSSQEAAGAAQQGSKVVLVRRSKPTEIKPSNNLVRRKPSIYPTPQHKEIFLFWNSTGCIIPKHKEDPASKTFQESMLAITKALRKYTVDQITDSICNYDRLLADPNTTIVINGVGHRVPLYEYFKFTNHTEQRMIASRDPLTIISWFNECLKGYDHLQTTFGKYDKDDNPNVTKALIKEYKSKIADKPLSVQDVNCFIRSSKFVIDYHQKYKDKINWNSCLMEKNNPANFAYRLVIAVLEDAQDPLMIEPTWLCSSRTINSRFPKYLKRHGLVTVDDFKSNQKSEAKKQPIVKKGYDPGYKDGEI